MKTKVWLSLFFICSLLCVACTNTDTTEAETVVMPVQDTLGMEPDFSYAYNRQKPFIFVDQIGYCIDENKVAYFEGKKLDENFDIIDCATSEVVYSGKIIPIKILEEKMLYIGDFTDFNETGKYYIHHSQVGESFEFMIDSSVYRQEFEVLQKSAKEYTYNNVSDTAYVIAHMLFVKDFFEQKNIDTTFVEERLKVLLYSQDVGTGAFGNDILKSGYEPVRAVSLTTTAQMAGVLAHYSILYAEENSEFAVECLDAAKMAYEYMIPYRENAEADAWYYAAVQLYRATGQIKYREMVREYDKLAPEMKRDNGQEYTMLADFIYLSTDYRTDYSRCKNLLKQYMDRAQEISRNSARDNFYVMPQIENMSKTEVLDDMSILGLVNYVLSGREYAEIQHNYIHYLAGVNGMAKNFLYDEMIASLPEQETDVATMSKLIMVFGAVD